MKNMKVSQDQREPERVSQGTPPTILNFSPPQKKQHFLIRIYNRFVNTIIEIVEPCYWAILNFFVLKENSWLRRFIKLIRKNILFFITAITGYFLARAIIVYPARHLIVYTFLPVFFILVFTKPIWGVIIYLTFSLGMIHKAIWNFPRLYMGTPVLLLTISGWILSTLKGVNKKIHYVNDSNNIIAILIWSLAALHVLLRYGNLYQSTIQCSWILTFFVLIHVIGKDKKKLNYLLHALVAIYGFYIYKVLRKAIYFGFATSYTISAEIPGRMSDNNELAACLVMVMPLYYALFLNSTKKWTKYTLLLFFCLNAVAVIYTRSRGGYISMFIVFLLIIIKLILSAKNRKQGIIFLSIFLIAGYGVLYEKINDRIQDIVNWDTDQSAHNRILSLAAGWEMMYAQPLKGVGMGRAYPNFLKYCPSEITVPNLLKDGQEVTIRRPKKALVIHNAYAQVLGETGIPGIFFFLSFLFASLFKMSRLRKIIGNDPNDEWAIPISYALQFSIIGFMISGVFLSNAQAGIIYVLVACTSSLWYVTIGKNEPVSIKKNRVMTVWIFLLFLYWLFMTIVYLI